MSEQTQRHLFIDLLRFSAAFFMIQGHVFDAVLSAQSKTHHLYQIHNFFHGFVAPAFLYASGVAYGAATTKRWDEHALWGRAARRRIGKFLGLIAIGYALHLPYFSLRKTIQASPDELRSLMQSDVLQCIGVTLLLLQIGILLTKKTRVFEWAVALTAVGVIFLAPLTWSAHFSKVLPTAVASYLSAETGSWFPVIPWSGYILCGVLFGSMLARTENSTRTSALIGRSTALNTALFLLSWAVMYFPADFYPPHDFWKSNPAMFFVRVSAVMLVGNGLFLAERWWRLNPRIPAIIGRSSLFVYVLHLVIVYGSVVNRGLAQRFGPTLPVSSALGLVVGVFIVIAFVTIFWHELKSRHKTVADGITAGGATIFLLVFFVRPW